MVPMLTEKNRIKRSDWAKKYKYKHWCHAIFGMKPHFGSIEVSFVYGQNLERSFIDQQKHSANVHVWAAFSSMETFPLCIFTQNLTGDLFVKIFEWHLIDQAETFHGKNIHNECERTDENVEMEQ